DLIEHIQCLNQTTQDVCALFSFIQAVLGTANNDLDLVSHVVAQHLIDTQGAWHAINDGEHIRAEGSLQLGVLVQVVEHHARYGITLERNNNAHAYAVRRFIFNLGNTSDLAVGHGLRDIGDQVIWVDLVRQLRNNDSLAGGLLFNGAHPSHADRTTAGGVRILDAAITDYQTVGWEVCALHKLHAGFQRFFFGSLC